MKLIVGLGNPGIEYNKTRHNIGFMAIDYLAENWQVDISKGKLGGLYGEKIINNDKIILLKPQQYINLSGDIIYKFVKYFKININDILIIHDDMDTEIGNYKLRYKGGSAGHNGLKNIEFNLKTKEYKRLKIGISKNKRIDSADYVLGKFNKEENEKIMKVMETIPVIVNDFMLLTFENLMNKYNM